MKQIWNGIQIAFSAFGGFLGWFLGGADGFLSALIAFVVTDYITGLMCAFADRNLSSEIGFKGICRKVLIFALVGIANLVDVSHQRTIVACVIFVIPLIVSVSFNDFFWTDSSVFLNLEPISRIVKKS